MTQVVIGDILPYTQATATAGQTVFGTNWTANYASDVIVYRTPSGALPNDVTQVLSYPSQYSVAFIGGSQQVQVTLVSGANLGDTITITRQTPADRNNLYSNTNFTPSMLNNDFGILTLVDQQAQLVNQLIGPRYNYSADITAVVDTILPILGANETWVKNNGNTAIIPYTLPSSGVAPAGDTYVLLTSDSTNLPNSFGLDTLGLGLLVNQPGTHLLTTTTVLGMTNQINVVNGNGSGGNIGISIASNPILPGTSGMGVPEGTTAQRVIPTSNVSFRYNTDIQSFEFWDGATWAQLKDSTDGGVNPGVQNQLAYYASDGNFVSGLATAQNGVLVTSNSSVPSILAGSGVTGNILQTVLGAAPTWSTAVYPSTTTVNEFLYSSSNNVVTGLATANDSVMVTSNAGVPSLSSTLPTAVQNNIVQLGAQVSALNMNSHLINNVTDPVNPQDAATKNYVDTTALNGTSVYAATTTNLTVTQSGAGVGATLTNAGAQAVFSIDGVNPSVGSNVLIKNLSNAAHEGIYTVTNVGSVSTNWVLTRATSYDTPSEINNTGLIIVQNGSTLQGTAWYNATTIITVDTTNFNYTQFGNVIFPISLSQGGTNASLTASNGGIFYSTATAGAILSGTSTARQMLQSGANAAPAWSTSTWPATTTINQILYSSAANIVSGLSTANNAVLGTNGSGVPSLSSTLPSNLVITTPNIITSLNDSNSNKMVQFNPQAGTIANWVAISNNVTGTGPGIGVAGTDTNRSLVLTGIGTGGVQVGGIADGTAPVVVTVGEYFSSQVLSGSAVSLSTTVAADVTSLALGAGDFDIEGNVTFLGSTINIGVAQAWLSTTSATKPDISLITGMTETTATFSYYGTRTYSLRSNSASSVTVYLSCQANFGTGTVTACGFISARRRR